VGWVNSSQSLLNVEYSVYKLDTDKVIIQDTVRKKLTHNNVDRAALFVADKIFDSVEKRYGGILNSNLYGDRAMVLKIKNGQPELVSQKLVKPSEISTASSEPSRVDKLLEKFQKLIKSRK
jgi:hypothetical protein